MDHFFATNIIYPNFWCGEIYNTILEMNCITQEKKIHLERTSIKQHQGINSPKGSVTVFNIAAKVFIIENTNEKALKRVILMLSHSVKTC